MPISGIRLVWGFLCQGYHAIFVFLCHSILAVAIWRRFPRGNRTGVRCFQIETQIARLNQDKPSWGAPKIREKLARLYRKLQALAVL
jgi:hypothetical protein